MARTQKKKTNNGDSLNNNQKGNRTGVKVPVTRQFVGNDGLEDPKAFFDAARSPESRTSLNNSSSAKNGTIESTPTEPRRQEEVRPKKRIIFTPVEPDPEENDKQQSSEKDDNNNNNKTDNTVGVGVSYQTATQKIGRAINQIRVRNSIDTVELSIVSTAPPLSERKQQPDDSFITYATRDEPQVVGNDSSEESRIETVVEDETNNDDDDDDAEVNNNESKNINTPVDKDENDEATFGQKIASNIRSPDVVPASDSNEPMNTSLVDNNDNNHQNDTNTPLNNDKDDDEDDLLPPPPPDTTTPEDDVVEDEDDDLNVASNDEINQTENEPINSPQATPIQPRKLAAKTPDTVPFTAPHDRYDVNGNDDFEDDDKDGSGFDIVNNNAHSDDDETSDKKKPASKNDGDARKKKQPTSSDDDDETTKKKGKTSNDLQDTDSEDEVVTKKSKKKSKNVSFSEDSTRVSKKSSKTDSSVGSDKGSKKSLKQKSKKDEKKRKATSISQEDIEDSNTTKPRKKKPTNPYATVFESHGIPQERTFTVIPVAELKKESSSSTPNAKNLRRSKRVRMKPLEFWKGECVEYGPNDFGDEYDGVTNMSVPVYVHRADPTPYKPRKITRVISNGKSSDAKKRKSTSGTEPSPAAKATVQVQPFDASHLYKKFSYKENGVAHLWDQVKSVSKDTAVVAREQTFKFRELPITGPRKSSEGSIVGKAAQAFYFSNKNSKKYPGFIMGKLLLPKRGIKDAESVGVCAQTFTVVSGQPNSLELSFSDPTSTSERMDPNTATRFLLSPGDLFCIPAGNTYRLQNHSKTMECIMTWTIIRSIEDEDG